MSSSLYGAPYFYDYNNSVSSLIHPSTTYVSNTTISRIFKRYLLQKAISVFDWTFPENWVAPYYPLYCLYTFGYFAIINTDKFGVIPQQCGLQGLGVMYQPTGAIISNPLIRDIHNLTINKDCIVVQLQPDFGGIDDLIEMFGDLLALCLEAGSVNLLNSRLAYFAVGETKGQAETYKKMIDDVISGKPACVFDKTSMPTDKSIQDVFQLFNTQVKQNFIAPEIFILWKTIENMFDTEIGIPSANTEKRERMISAEINVGSVETYSRVDMWLKLLQKRLKQAREMFNLSESELYVKWRYSPELTGMSGEGLKNESSGTNNNSNNV